MLNSLHRLRKLDAHAAGHKSRAHKRAKSGDFYDGILAHAVNAAGRNLILPPRKVLGPLGAAWRF